MTCLNKETEKRWFKWKIIRLENKEMKEEIMGENRKLKATWMWEKDRISPETEFEFVYNFVMDIFKQALILSIE